MDISEAIDLLNVIKYCDADEVARVKAIDMAIVALQEQERRNFNPRLTSEEDLQKLYGKSIWWDFWGGDWCLCKNGYVVVDGRGTFSFGFVLVHGSAYRRKPNSIT